VIRTAGLSTLEKTRVELFVVFKTSCRHKEQSVERPHRIKVRRVGRSRDVVGDFF